MSQFFTITPTNLWLLEKRSTLVCDLTVSIIYTSLGSLPLSSILLPQPKTFTSYSLLSFPLPHQLLCLVIVSHILMFWQTFAWKYKKNPAMLSSYPSMALKLPACLVTFTAKVFVCFSPFLSTCLPFFPDYLTSFSFTSSSFSWQLTTVSSAQSANLAFGHRAYERITLCSNHP